MGGVCKSDANGSLYSSARVDGNISADNTTDIEAAANFLKRIWSLPGSWPTSEKERESSIAPLRLTRPALLSFGRVTPSGSVIPCLPCRTAVFWQPVDRKDLRSS